MIYYEEDEHGLQNTLKEPCKKVPFVRVNNEMSRDSDASDTERWKWITDFSRAMKNHCEISVFLIGPSGHYILIQ